MSDISTCACSRLRPHLLHHQRGADDGHHGALFFLNWKLAFIGLAFFPALLAVALRFSRRLNPVLKDVQQKIADVTTVAQENVVGSRIVKIFAREDDELAKFSERSTAVFEASISAARLRAVYVPLIGFLPNLAVGVLLWYGGRQVVNGSMSLGSLVAFYTYLMMLVYPARCGLAHRAGATGHRLRRACLPDRRRAAGDDAEHTRRGRSRGRKEK